MKMIHLLLFLFCVSSKAAIFSTDYLSFNISDDWECLPSGLNWVCEPKNPQAKRLNIITVTAKFAGPNDNLEAFQSHLSKPRSHQMGSNTPVMSQVLKVTRRQVGNWQWVQGTHLSSEVRDFFTTYLGTVKNGVAIMVTFSSEKDHWAKAEGFYETVISTIRLKNFSTPTKSAEGNPIFASQGGSSQEAMDILASQEGVPQKSLPKVYVIGIGIALLILGAAVFIFLKSS